MRRFILQTCYFTLSVFFVFLSFFLFTLWLIRDNKYYRIPEQKHILAVGHSHGSSAFIGADFPGSYNICSGGETYNFTFSKLKKLLEANSQVDTVLLFVSNNLFDATFDARLWSEAQISDRLKRHLPIMDDEFLARYFSKHPFGGVNDLLVSTVEQVKFLTSQKATIFDFSVWGGFDAHQKEISEQDKKDSTCLETHVYENFFYFKKIVSMCKSENRTLILIATPLNSAYSIDCHYENKFRAALSQSASESIFIDFRRMHLPDSCFLNMDHLNEKGAKIFTRILKKNWSLISKQGKTDRNYFPSDSLLDH